MPKVDRTKVKAKSGSSYPPPFDQPCHGRRTRRLSEAVGLSQFGVNLVTLPPGAWASQRHWHECEDEFAFILEGEVTLVEDSGETVLRAGDSAGWPAGVHDGHHLINRSDKPARFLVVGSRNDEDYGEYSDIDMSFSKGRYSGGKKGIFCHKDGTPY